MIRGTTSEWRCGKKRVCARSGLHRQSPSPGRAVLVVWYKEGIRRFRCRLGSPGSRARCSHMLHAGAATAACFCFPAWPCSRFFVFDFLGSPVCRACFSRQTCLQGLFFSSCTADAHFLSQQFSFGLRQSNEFEFQIVFLGAQTPI